MALSTCGDFPELEPVTCLNLRQNRRVIDGVITEVDHNEAESVAMLTGKTDDTGAEFWLSVEITCAVPVIGQHISYNPVTETVKIFDND